MAYVEISGDKVPCNEDAAVALQRVLLCAHYGDGVLLGAHLDAIETVLKQRLSGEAVIDNFAVFVTAFVRASRS